MTHAINLVTGDYSDAEALVFVPVAAIDHDTLENAQYDSDEGDTTPIMEIGARHGFLLNPFAPLVFSSVDHPKYGTINDVFDSEDAALGALEGLLDEGEEFDPEVGILQHLIDEHRCVISLEEFADPRLKRVNQVSGWEHFGYLFEGESAATPAPGTTKLDALDAVSQALSLLAQADLSGLDADILDDLRKATSALNNAEQYLTPQD